MKAIKFMLSACVAAVALTSCEKEDIVPQAQNTRMKSIEISLKNAVVTRGLAGEKISKGDPVRVNNLKIFLTDAAGNLYKDAKTSDGSQAAQYYWNSEDLASAVASEDGLKAEFHYVDPNCTKVVAVANCDDIDFADLGTINIDDEQDATNLSLYAEDNLENSNGQHSDVNADGTTYLSNVYKADLHLTPRISRFEVDGFRVNFDATNPKYQEIKILDIAFQNYYSTTTLADPGTESGPIVNYMDVANQTEVYGWFNDNTKTQGWYWDSFTSALSLTDITPDTPVADIKDSEDNKAPLAYHIFSCTETPVMVIRLTADGQPAYIYSKGFRNSGNDEPITEFKEGMIYRMSAEGEVSGSDGSIPIDEEDIDPMDRCLEIKVTVVPWDVELVYPEF